MHRRESLGGARFITFSCHRRLPLLNDPEACEDFLDALDRSRTTHGVQVFAWVLMPEHVHLLARPSEQASMGLVLRSVKMAVAKRAIDRWKQAGSTPEGITDQHGSPRFWQAGGGFDRNVRDDSEFAREVNYIHRNPVERGLVAMPSEWRWSSVRWWMGERDGEFACDPPPGPPGSWDMWKGYM